MKDTERKIVVISDSHGSTDNMEKLFAMHRDADAFIHLGDGAREFAVLCRKNGKVGYSMLGNCDFSFECPFADSPHAIYTIGEKKFFMTHGSAYGVKYGVERLLSVAREKCPDADFVLYGHTHVSENRYIPEENGFEKPIYLINPGSIARPRGGLPSYALILIKGDSVLTNIAYT